MRAHEQLSERSLRTPIGKGGEGKGDRKGRALLHASYLTDADPLAAATATLGFVVACKKQIQRWSR